MDADVAVLARERRRQVVDIAAPTVVVDHSAHGQPVGNEWNVESRVEVAALITVRSRCVAGVHRGFSHIELRLVGDVAHDASLRPRSEQRALRTLQYLDALEIGGVDVKIAAWKLRGLVVQIHRDVRERPENARRLYASLSRRQAADVDVVLPGAHTVRGDTGQIGHEVIKGRRVEPGQRFSRQHLNRDGYVLEILLAAIGGDDHLVHFLPAGGTRGDR